MFPISIILLRLKLEVEVVIEIEVEIEVEVELELEIEVEVEVAPIIIEVAPIIMNRYPVYHSVYDSFHWMQTYGDPGFKYHRTCAQVWGLLALALASENLLPMNVVDHAAKLAEYKVASSAQARKISAAAPCAPVLPLSQRKIHTREGYYMEFFCGLT